MRLVSLITPLLTQTAILWFTVQQAKIDRDLKKDVDSEIGGNFRDVARLLMMSNADLDATLVHKAIKGIGTNEQLLIEVLCTRSGDDMKAMKESYERLFEHAMLKDVKDDTSGEFKSTLVALIESKRETPKDEQVAEDVEKLYQVRVGSALVAFALSSPRALLCTPSHSSSPLFQDGCKCRHSFSAHVHTCICTYMSFLICHSSIYSLLTSPGWRE
jgi:hypothetical protein